MYNQIVKPSYFWVKYIFHKQYFLSCIKKLHHGERFINSEHQTMSKM